MELGFSDYCGTLTAESVKSTDPDVLADDSKVINSSMVEVKDPNKPGTPEPVDFIPFGGEDVNESQILFGSKKQSKKFKKGRYWKDLENEVGGTPRKGKRRLEDNSGGVRKKTPRITPDKTASSVLHELCPTLVYEYEGMEGPAHEPCFTVKVFYPPTNKEYVGSGRSKKLGKNDVAAKVLEDLGISIPKPEENSSLLLPHSQKSSQISIDSVFMTPQKLDSTPMLQDIDFASDDVMFEDDFNNTVPSAPQYLEENQLSFYIRNLDPKVINRIRNIPNLDKNSCLAINSLNMSPDPANYTFISDDGPPHAKTFIYQLNYLGLEFKGKGNSKKLAKADAARKCLNLILTQIAPMDATPGSELPQDGHEDDPDAPQYNVAFSDHVYRLVNEKYELIMRDDPEHISQKVMAGIVMTKGGMIETAEVIAVSTGTKCIEGDSMSELGLALNDCHAEILATRCLRDYFYSQLDLLTKNSESIFELAEDSADGTKRFKLKPEVKFHLYINTSPCGDARIFSPKGFDENIETTSPADSHPNRNNRGLLRAKIEAGEGTIPVLNLNKGPQTWDAILQGNALNTMSCSDKVCRWNVLGLQGALLSNLMDPIYYSSIILGSLHHPIHFRRAVIGRIEDLETAALPPGYKVNKPYLLMISNEETRRVKKSPNHAVTWCISWSSHEVLSAAKGRVKVGNVPSRVSKRQAYMRFLNILKYDKKRVENFVGVSYGDAKGLAMSYQEAKEKFNNLMVEGNLGSWISKPAEQDSFLVN